MKLQRRFALTSDRITPESVARLIGICNYIEKNEVIAVLYSYDKDISAYLEKTMVQQCFSIKDNMTDRPESVLDIIF